MESKELQRTRKINRICEMVERATGVAFHKIEALDKKDITFIDEDGDIEITVEKFDEYGNVSAIDVSWDYLSDDVLNEIIEIINESNQGITY